MSLKNGRGIMKQRDWVEEWENRETWVVFDQAGKCFGIIIEEFKNYGVITYQVRCRCDMQKNKTAATNNIKQKNVKSYHKSFKEAEDAYKKRYNK
jgi:hypothetical protein